MRGLRKHSSVIGTAVQLLLLLIASQGNAEIRLPNILSDHAVLQREGPIRIWGWATPGARLTIHFHEQGVTTTADELGEWTAWLAPEHAGGPYTLDIDGGTPEAKKELTDVMVGDVWVAAGQSNMEMPLKGFPPTAAVKDADHEIATADNPMLRLLVVGHKSSDVPLQDITGLWSRCTPETASEFSAIAYFFGRKIANTEHVTMGLIDASWGGTPIDSWISLDSLSENPSLLSAFANRARFANQQSNVGAQIASERSADAAARQAGKPIPIHPWHPEEDSWLPAGLYNGMIAPLRNMSIKGFLWYQGETDSGPLRAPHYRVLFPALILDWRARFRQGSLPFLFVQISSFHSPAETWGVVRDAQRRTLFIANTAMVVSLDVGTPENVHPPDKQTVADRLALAALHMAYGERVEYQSPLFRQATIEGEGVRVWFDNAEGLSAKGKEIKDFEIASGDHVFKPATATIQGETILVSSPEVSHPKYVRYGWRNVVTSWFYNGQGLPGSTFTSEDVPLDGSLDD